MPQIEAFFDAIERQNIPEIRRMIAEGIDVNQACERDVYYFTGPPLNLDMPQRVKIKSLPILQAMLCGWHTRFPLYRDNRHGRSIIPPNIEILKLLIENGANIDAINKLGINFKLKLYGKFNLGFNYVSNTYRIEFEVNNMAHTIGNDSLLDNPTEIAKILISNGAQELYISLVAASNSDYNNFLAEVYLPLDLQSTDDVEQINDTIFNKRKDDLLLKTKLFTEHEIFKPFKILTSFIAHPMIRSHLTENIKKLIRKKIINMTPEQMAAARSYLLRDKIVVNTLFHRMLQPFLSKQIIEPDFKAAQFQESFAQQLKKPILANRAAFANDANLEHIQKWCNKVATAIENHATIITTQELTYIFSIILAATAGDVKNAKDALLKLEEKTKNHTYFPALIDIIKEARGASPHKPRKLR